MIMCFSKKSGRVRKFFSSFLVIGGLLSCGAPNNQPGHSIALNAPAATLASKTESLCRQLADRKNPPNLSNSPWNYASCANPRQEPIHSSSLNTVSDFHIGDYLSTSLKSSTPDQGGYFVIEMRTRLYTGKTLLSFLLDVLDTLKKAEEESFEEKAKTKEVEIKAIDPLKFDVESGKISGKMQLLSETAQNGYLKINNQIQIEGGFIDQGRALAVNIFTNQSSELSDSLIRSLSGIIIGFAQADDSLIDLSLRVELYSFNADTLLDYVFRTAMEKAHQEIAHFIWPKLLSPEEPEDLDEQ